MAFGRGSIREGKGGGVCKETEGVGRRKGKEEVSRGGGGWGGRVMVVLVKAARMMAVFHSVVITVIGVMEAGMCVNVCVRVRVQD